MWAWAEGATGRSSCRHASHLLTRRKRSLVVAPGAVVQLACHAALVATRYAVAGANWHTKEPASCGCVCVGGGGWGWGVCVGGWGGEGAGVLEARGRRAGGGAGEGGRRGGGGRAVGVCGCGWWAGWRAVHIASRRRSPIQATCMDARAWSWMRGKLA